MLATLATFQFVFQMFGQHKQLRLSLTSKTNLANGQAASLRAARGISMVILFLGNSGIPLEVYNPTNDCFTCKESTYLLAEDL